MKKVYCTDVTMNRVTHWKTENCAKMNVTVFLVVASAIVKRKDNVELLMKLSYRHLKDKIRGVNFKRFTGCIDFCNRGGYVCVDGM